MPNKSSCCSPSSEQIEKRGWFSGLIFGLMPHTFCLLFILFSAIGAVGATTFLKNVLLVPHLFTWLIILSFVFVAISAIIYLKKTGNLSHQGIKSKRKYLGTMFATTIATNFIVVFVLLPSAASMQVRDVEIYDQNQSTLSLKVGIPCSGHAPLIIDEIKTLDGISDVTFNLPNNFTVYHDSTKISPDQISSLKIFKTFPLLK